VFGQERTNIARLNADASLDTTFNSGANGGGAVVECLAVQPDGNVLVGGSFTTLSGQSQPTLGRVRPNGTLDGSLQSMGALNLTLASLNLQANGQILISGEFDDLAGQPRKNIGRLNKDGTLDGDFNPHVLGSG